jgi:predicted alpha/beta superfamily hydrolase
LFLTATEVAWRRAASSHFSGGGIIVAVGYPLTPPSPTPIEGYGGANEFLDFIEGPVRSAVQERLPKVSFSREALYGHSYGGLFALHALFTRSNAFDCYIASSPSIWWNSRCILHEAEKFLKTQAALQLPKTKDKSPALMLSWGGFEQNPPQWDNEPLDHYEGRKQIAKDLRMADNTIDLYEMVKKCEKLGAVTTYEYDQEEHTSVMPCSLSRGLTRFFEDWPFHGQ